MKNFIKKYPGYTEEYSKTIFKTKKWKIAMFAAIIFIIMAILILLFKLENNQIIIKILMVLALAIAIILIINGYKTRQVLWAKHFKK